jgi:hypothetical protein
MLNFTNTYILRDEMRSESGHFSLGPTEYYHSFKTAIFSVQSIWLGHIMSVKHLEIAMASQMTHDSVKKLLVRRCTT